MIEIRARRRVGASLLRAATFGELVAELRNAAGRSRDDVARSMGVDPIALEVIERGEALVPPRSWCRRFAAACRLAERDAASLLAMARAEVCCRALAQWED